MLQRRIVIRKHAHSDSTGDSAIVAIISESHIALCHFGSNIYLTPSEAVHLAAEIIKNYPLDALS